MLFPRCLVLDAFHMKNPETVQKSSFSTIWTGQNIAARWRRQRCISQAQMQHLLYISMVAVLASYLSVPKCKPAGHQTECKLMVADPCYTTGDHHCGVHIPPLESRHFSNHCSAPAVRWCKCFCHHQRFIQCFPSKSFLKNAYFEKWFEVKYCI